MEQLCGLSSAQMRSVWAELWANDIGLRSAAEFFLRSNPLRAANANIVRPQFRPTRCASGRRKTAELLHRANSLLLPDAGSCAINSGNILRMQVVQDVREL